MIASGNGGGVLGRETLEADAATILEDVVAATAGSRSRGRRGGEARRFLQGTREGREIRHGR